MNNKFEIEPISVKRNVIIRKKDKNIVNEIMETSNISEMSEKVYNDAFAYARETGRDVVVQGAKIQITIAETGRFRKHKEIQVAFDLPSVKL